MVGRVLEEEAGDERGVVELVGVAVEGAEVDEVAEFAGVREEELGGVLAEDAAAEDAGERCGPGGESGGAAGANVGWWKGHRVSLVRCLWAGFVGWRRILRFFAVLRMTSVFMRGGRPF